MTSAAPNLQRRGHGNRTRSARARGLEFARWRGDQEGRPSWRSRQSRRRRAEDRTTCGRERDRTANRRVVDAEQWDRLSPYVVLLVAVGLVIAGQLAEDLADTRADPAPHPDVCAPPLDADRRRASTCSRSRSSSIGSCSSRSPRSIASSRSSQTGSATTSTACDGPVSRSTSSCSRRPALRRRGAVPGPADVAADRRRGDQGADVPARDRAGCGPRAHPVHASSGWAVLTLVWTTVRRARALGPALARAAPRRRLRHDERPAARQHRARDRARAGRRGRHPAVRVRGADRARQLGPARPRLAREPGRAAPAAARHPRPDGGREGSRAIGHQPSAARQLRRAPAGRAAVGRGDGEPQEPGRRRSSTFAGRSAR